FRSRRTALSGYGNRIESGRQDQRRSSSSPQPVLRSYAPERHLLSGDVQTHQEQTRSRKKDRSIKLKCVSAGKKLTSFHTKLRKGWPHSTKSSSSKIAIPFDWPWWTSSING